MDMNEYWREIRSIQDALPQGEHLLMVSESVPKLGMKAGVFVEVARPKAAQHLYDKTHRLATAEEADTYRAAEAAKRNEALREADLRAALDKIYPRPPQAAAQPANPQPEPAEPAGGKKGK